MKIAVSASEKQWEELTTGITNITWQQFSLNDDTADAFILLDKGLEASTAVTKPVLLNTVINTLKDINAPANVIRINGWNGFLKREKWEVVGNITDKVQEVFSAMNKQALPVKDEPGLVSARTIAMIINEAYFALEDEVSTKDEIDTAMKLGTNYPLGPFEWVEQIGKKNIYELLQKLATSDNRYIPSALLKKEAIQ